MRNVVVMLMCSFPACTFWCFKKNEKDAKRQKETRGKNGEEMGLDLQQEAEGPVPFHVS